MGAVPGDAEDGGEGFDFNVLSIIYCDIISRSFGFYIITNLAYFRWNLLFCRYCDVAVSVTNSRTVVYRNISILRIRRIEDERIRVLSERATWIGNDETHYVKKHENLDIAEMKRFIDAVLHYIESELSFEVALSIQPKK